jgi:outer membrane protein assembly factor BamB
MMMSKRLSASQSACARRAALGIVGSLLLAAAFAASGCGAGSMGVDYGRLDGTGSASSGPALRVRWSKQLGPEYGGAYVPVERAAAAIDPLYGRVYVGSTQRTLWAFSPEGRPLYEYTTESGIEAEPTLDAQRNELYVATAGGRVHSLRASDGSVRFTVDLGASVSQPGVLSEDALYLVTDADGVFALSRKDGTTLWRYQREPRSGLKVSGHAGLLSSDQRIITGFSDGSVVALAKGDGHAVWVVDTTLDFADPAQSDQGFVDVDTTPVQVGDTIYVASFLAGFYGLSAQDGTAQFRNAELTGVTSIAADERTILLASAERGVVCYDLPTLTARWSKHQDLRGAANHVQVRGRTAYVTETRGAFLALALADGRETGRLQTEHGFAASPSLVEGRGFILGNAGVLYAFDY